MAETGLKPATAADNEFLSGGSSAAGDGDGGRETKTAVDRAAALLPGPAPINILIVDDEPRNLAVLEAVLNDPGYRLIRAESAEQALLALLVDEFALLILDIR